MPSSFTILIVDDNEALAGAIERWTPDVHDTNLTHSCEAAIEELQDTEYDVVLLDQNLGDGLGYDVLDEVGHKLGDTFVTMLTSQPAGFDAFEKPIDGYLTKPVTGDDVQSMVSRFESLQNASDAAIDAASTLAIYYAVDHAKHNSELEKNDHFQSITDNIDEYEEAVENWLASPTEGLAFLR